MQKSNSSDNVTQLATRDDAARGDEDESPPPKRQRTDLPTRSVTPNNTVNNDPWKLQPLLLLANSDLAAFAQHELFVFVVGNFLVIVLPSKAPLQIETWRRRPSWLTHSAIYFSKHKLVFARLKPIARQLTTMLTGGI
jgi:hypothetical protein